MGVAAPVVLAEMADWVALGGGNSGIVGNAAHTFGFHVAANELPADDYSRVQDPNGSDGPYVNWDYACAGDFGHGGDESLRAMHRALLARLMRGELPMICEFIGQPWADQPVYYWARWNGVGVLQRYTGQGHDMWSHISWYRSTVDQRAYLWVTAPTSREDSKMHTIVPSGLPASDPNKWLMCDGTFARLIDETNRRHAINLHNNGAIQLWKGGEPWVGGWVPAFGVLVTTLGSPVTREQLEQIKAAAAAGGEVGAPTRDELEQAAFQGAQRAERE
jgi:hypothetical protein